MIRRRPAGHRLFEVEPTRLAVQVNEASRMNRVGMLNYDEPIGSQRVHASLYIDAHVFADAKAAIFSQGWVFVGHDRQVVEPGDWVSAASDKRR